MPTLDRMGIYYQKSTKANATQLRIITRLPQHFSVRLSRQFQF